MNLPDVVVLYFASETAARADLPAGFSWVCRRRSGAIGKGRARRLQKPAPAVGAALRNKPALQAFHEFYIDKIQQPVKVHFFDDLGFFLLAADAVLRLHRRRVCLRVFTETDAADKCCALKWEGINYAERSIHVCRNAIKTTGDEIIVKAPKTKAGNRYVYFSAEMESLLREYETFCAAETERYDRREQTKDDYVFRRKGMKLPMTPSTFTWRFKKILKANDLPTDLNVHSLRHTAASLFIASGTDVGTVAGLLGHSQPSTTLDIYTHAFDKNKKAASQIMQSNLEI